MKTKVKTIAAIACGVVACGLSQSAHANLVLNGGFESTSTGGGTGHLGVSGYSVPDWTSSGNSYDFVFAYATATSTGTDGLVLGGTETPLAGTGNNFLGVDATYPSAGDPHSISQSVNVTAGDTYTLSFYWAAALQSGSPAGPTGQGWAVSLGGGTPTETLPLVTVTKGTFDGWYTDTITFTPTTGGSEALKFTALATLAGGVSGTQPPFDLLDGVSLTQNTVPDSTSTAGLLGLGVVAMGVAAGCRRFVRA